MSWYRNYFISIVANNGKEQIKHKTWVLSKFFLLFRKMFQRSFTNSNAAKTERMTLSFQPKDSKTRQELIMNIFPKISRQIYKEGKMCLKKNKYTKFYFLALVALLVGGGAEASFSTLVFLFSSSSGLLFLAPRLLSSWVRSVNTWPLLLIFVTAVTSFC